MRTLAPLDIDTILDSVRKTVEGDGRLRGQPLLRRRGRDRRQIAEQALFDLDAPIVRIGGPHIPAMPFAAPLEHFFMDPSRTRSTRGCASSPAA